MENYAYILWVTACGKRLIIRNCPYHKHKTCNFPHRPPRPLRPLRPLRPFRLPRFMHLRTRASSTTRAPERQRHIDANGVGLAVYEWGAADAPPVLLVHGALDFARTFDVFAPLIAD